MKILLLNQCFYPDVVATAQYLTDLAAGLSARGHAVTVVASDRGYDDPKVRYPRRETWKGIKIVRIPSLTLGKKTKMRRALNFASFLTLCSLKLASLHHFDVVVALTSPPLISFLASLFVKLKGGRFCFWVMDLNPDEAIAAGWLKADTLTARFLQWMLRHSLTNAAQTIVLDRFMRERILGKGIDPQRVTIVPPWSQDDAIRFTAEGRRRFRERHGLTEKFVVMYSGNHSPCHPLDTFLEAARNLSVRSEFAFCFVGGGSEQNKVREFAAVHQLNTVKCLPYQPLGELADSLSAADLHLVVMGDRFAGIVHPSKIYNIMAVGAPVLYIGPEPTHVTDLAGQDQAGQFFLASHGDANTVVARILEASKQHNQTKRTRTRTHQTAPRFSKETLLTQLIRLIESSCSTAPAVAEAVAPDSV